MVGPRLSDSFDSEQSVGDGGETSDRRLSGDDRAFAGGDRAIGAGIAVARREAKGTDVEQTMPRFRTKPRRLAPWRMSLASPDRGRAAQGGAGQSRRDDPSACSMS